MVKARIRPRAKSAAAFLAEHTAEPIILAEREIAFVTDTGEIKIGDGVTPWPTLPSLPNGGVTGGQGIDVVGSDIRINIDELPLG